MGTFKEYIDRLYPQLESLSYNFATHRQSAEDLMQDALGAAWRVWLAHHNGKSTVELCKIGYRAVRNEIINKNQYHQASKRVAVLVEIDNDRDAGPNFFDAIDLKLDIEKLPLSTLGRLVLQELVNPTDETVRLATNWRNHNHQKYLPWRIVQPKIYAEALGVSSDMVAVALEEVLSKIRTLRYSCFIQVEGDMDKDYTPDPMDFEEGSLAPKPEAQEPEAWVPVPTSIYNPPVPEENEEEEVKGEEVIIDLDNIPEVTADELADLGSEEKKPPPKKFEDLSAQMPPESRERAQKAADVMAVGLRPGSKIAKVWDWLQPNLDQGPITREQVRIATSCALGLDKDKAASWARRAVEDLRKKGLLVRVEKNQYQRGKNIHPAQSS